MEKYHMENMTRALQPELMTYIGFIILALAVYLAGWWLGKLNINNGFELDGKNFRRWGRNVALFVVLFTLFVAAYRVATYSAVNRVPRSDVDGSAVYDTMRKNAEPKQ
jgi:uncharacterized membrane protein YedE/YeeE